MEWEEALLRAWGGEVPRQRAMYYRRRAARARQLTDWMTTPGAKAQLLDEAVQCDQLAADADRRPGGAARDEERGGGLRPSFEVGPPMLAVR